MDDFIYPKPQNLRTVFNDKYKIPNFQRPFSWDKDNVEEILDDLFKAFNNQNKYTEYYVGTIYVVTKDNSENQNNQIVIDGQQRLTFFFLLLLIFEYHLTQNEDYFDGDKDDLDETENDLKRVTTYKYNSQKMSRLITHGFDKEILEHIFNWSKQRQEWTKDNLAGDILKNFQFMDDKKNQQDHLIQNYKMAIKLIHSFLNDKFSNAGKIDELNKFVQFVLEKIIILKISFTKYELARILDTFIQINTRGKKLDILDLIKAFLFRKYEEADPKNYADKCEQSWSYLLKNTHNQLFDYLEKIYKTSYRFSKNKINFKNFQSFNKDFYKNKTKYSDIGTKLETGDKKDIELFLDFLMDPKKIEAFNILYYGFAEKGNSQTNEYASKMHINLYLNLFKLSNYVHHQNLIFRSILAYLNQKVEINQLLEIFKQSFRFLFTFQTIYARDSKDSIKPFQNMINDVIRFRKFPTKEEMIEKFNNQGGGFDYENLEEIKKQAIRSNKSGDKKHNINKTILLLSTISKEKPTLDKIMSVIHQIKTHHLDHIIPQKTKSSEEGYWEVIQKQKQAHVIRILDQSWFNGRLAKDEDIEDYQIPQEKWDKFVTNNIGNQQMLEKEINIELQNSDKKQFSSFKEIDNRAKEIIDDFINSTLFK